MTSLVLASTSLFRREMVRFYRQRSRVIGALLTPVVFWIVIGSGLGRSFQALGSGPGGGYLEYFFPGALVMTLLFTSIFSTISIIEDRKEGFLQSVLVAPVSRMSIVFGKVLGAAALASVQGLLFLLLGPFVGISINIWMFFVIFVLMFWVSLGLSLLGFLIAWRMTSTQGFHAIMNLFLLPMWLLSGAAFPASGAPTWIGMIMTINPLTYGMALIRRAMYLSSHSATLELPSANLSFAVLTGFVVVLTILAVLEVKRSRFANR